MGFLQKCCNVYGGNDAVGVDDAIAKLRATLKPQTKYQTNRRSLERAGEGALQ